MSTTKKLKEYKSKRKLGKTPEPGIEKKNKRKGELKFVVQKHDASHLHYDFRLELDGVLKSWAIPKGPSMNPKDKRLAMMVEDHPLEYANFEGIIPKGNYGAGTVMVWDEGVYRSSLADEGKENVKLLEEGLKDGNLKFVLHGKKLKGEFALVRLKKGKGNEWLLIKKKDPFSIDGDITKKSKSVKTDRSLSEIKNDSGKGKTVWHSSDIPMDNIDLPSAAVLKAFPHKIKPMLATLTEEPFDGKDWIFEIKWDGYRIIAEVNYRDVDIYSRNQLSYNDKFSEIRRALSELGLQVVFDGEICVIDPEGKSDFHLIQNYVKTGKGLLVYYVFDVIYFNGYDLQNVPLIQRKQLLKKLIPTNNDKIRFSDHINEKGKNFFSLSKEMHLEGVMAKKSESIYEIGKRSDSWLKVKNYHKQKAIVTGYTQPKGGRSYFGALVLGVYVGKKLKYIGNTGGGFKESDLKKIAALLKPLSIAHCPFEEEEVVNMGKDINWVKPEVAIEVKFQEWTKDGLMRIPIFQGVISESKKKKKIQLDKENIKNKINENETSERSPKIKSKSKSESSGGIQAKKKKTGRPSRDRKESGVNETSISDNNLIKTSNLRDGNNEAEIIINKHPLILTNLKKPYWKKEGYSKEMLLEYYHKISSFILPHLKDRPESLKRNPDGIEKSSFFQKDMPSSIPKWIQTEEIYSESNKKNINYLLCQNKATLIYMANLGCIEINPWLSRIQSMEYPDFLIIDLDPPGFSFDHVAEVALATKEILDLGKLKSFCKTSGSRGLHIYIPLASNYHYDQVRQFAELIATMVNKLVPKLTSLERKPEKRKNKIYIDYLQNRKGQTVAAPYCVRPVPNATVSTPLHWEELNKDLLPEQFTVETIFKRLENEGDIFKEVLSKGSDFEKAIAIWEGNKK